MSQADMRCFPFDVQSLPVLLKATPCRYLEHVIRSSSNCKVRGNALKFHMDNSTVMLSDVDYMAADHKGHGNFLEPGAGDSLVEFAVDSVKSRPGFAVYQVDLFIARPMLSSYCWNIIVVNVLAWLAGASYWDSASPDI